MFDLRKIFFPKSGKNRDFLGILEQFLGFLNFFFQLSTIQFIFLKKIYKFSLKPVKIMKDYLSEILEYIIRQFTVYHLLFI